MEAFLKEHADELTELDNGKIRCLITSHDIKKKLEILEVRISSKIYVTSENDGGIQHYYLEKQGS